MGKKINYLIFGLVISMLIIWSAILEKGQNQDFRLWMLDVGQGMAIYARFPGGFDLLYDGGPDNTVLEELGRVMPAWDREINLIISSHNHADHLVGLITVLEKFKVDQVWVSGATYSTATYKKFLTAIEENGAELKNCFISSDCQAPPLPSSQIDLLYPLVSLVGTEPKNQNNASLVVRIDYGQTSILLPGEVEKAAESEIVDFYCQDQNLNCQSLDIDILQSPHQGSKSSSTPDFLQATSPDLILIAVGLDNKYGHPHQEVLDRYHRFKAKFYRTDQCGSIEVLANLENYQINSNCHD